MDSFVFVFLGVHEPAGLVDECFLEPWEMFSPFLGVFFCPLLSPSLPERPSRVCGVAQRGLPLSPLAPSLNLH